MYIDASNSCCCIFALIYMKRFRDLFYALCIYKLFVIVLFKCYNHDIYIYDIMSYLMMITISRNVVYVYKLLLLF
jgi:hypothetical protein